MTIMQQSRQADWAVDDPLLSILSPKATADRSLNMYIRVTILGSTVLHVAKSWNSPPDLFISIVMETLITRNYSHVDHLHDINIRH